jgi:GntR family transcriptional repressor for pyruvate dehydrogenase complex
MLTQSPTTHRLHQHIADQIADMIRSRKYASGTRLPAERDLAQQFSVSRPTVREALVALEIAGIIEVRTGSGAYVASTKSATAAKVLDTGPSPFELLAARRMIEPSCAAMAATAATKKDLAAIRDALELNERVFKCTHWERLEADRQFHLRIVEATHNGMAARMVTDLWADMFGPIFAVLSERTRVTQKKLLTMQDHRTIFNCLERRDGAGASAAMLTHLVHAEIKLLRATVTPAKRRTTLAGVK